MRVLLAIALLLMSCGGGVRAEEIGGQQDPRFRAALALWLADDDVTALPELAALAADGNRAAQILLAQIDVMPSLQGPFVASLPRAERNALLRAPGGLSGHGWMQAAAADTPVAKLWLVALTPASTVKTALQFAALGESRAARATLLASSLRESRGFAAVAEDPNYPPDMRYLIWHEWAADPTGQTRIDAEIAALHPGDPQRAHVASLAIDPGAFDDWLATATLAAPLRTACAALCPKAGRTCTRAAYRLLSAHSDSEVFVSGYGGLQVAITSPSETLIAPDAWAASPRGRASILRQPETRAPFTDAVLSRLGETDTCFAAAVRAEAERFRK